MVAYLVDVQIELGVYEGLGGGVASTDRHHAGHVLKIIMGGYSNLPNGHQSDNAVIFTYDAFFLFFFFFFLSFFSLPLFFIFKKSFCSVLLFCFYFFSFFLVFFVCPFLLFVHYFLSLFFLSFCSFLLFFSF